MTPAERQLVTELFDRLATLEDAPRDPDAERAIRDGLAQAPNAVYALVQTALVQDEALKGASARIEELEAELARLNPPQRQGGFLDNMRDSIWGRQEQPRGSVPNVRPGEGPMGVPPGFGGQSGPQMSGPQGGPGYGGPGYGPQGQMQPPPEPGRGGSFLGTAAAAAAGVIGGSLLLDSIRGMTGGSGGRSGHALADTGQGGGGGGGLPWGRSGGGDELSRQAGLDDIGRSSGAGPFGQSQGMLNESRGGKGGDTDTYRDSNTDDENFADEDDGFDDGGDDFDSGDQ
ncbi:MAG: DUF2076 domain-containing protein [Xanthobacteraceae bacterium]|nr:DUF2076 domain-containing protein [Xanthobacteraceae bacterium]